MENVDGVSEKDCVVDDETTAQSRKIKAYYLAHILYENEDEIETYQVCGLCKRLDDIDEDIPASNSLESLSGISGKCSQAMTDDERTRRVLEIPCPEELEQKDSIGCFEPFETIDDIINSSDSEIFCFICGTKYDLTDEDEVKEALRHARDTHKRCDGFGFYVDQGNKIKDELVENLNIDWEEFYSFGMVSERNDEVEEE